MNEVFEALKSAMPTIPESSQDTQALSARIVANNPRSKDSTMRVFKLRMGAAVAAVSTATALGISALAGIGTSLPFISFEAQAVPLGGLHASGQKTLPSVSGMPGGMMICMFCSYPTEHLVAGPNFPTSLDQIPALEISWSNNLPDLLGLMGMSESTTTTTNSSIASFQTSSSYLSVSPGDLTFSANTSPTTGEAVGPTPFNSTETSDSALLANTTSLLATLDPQLTPVNMQVSTNSNGATTPSTGTSSWTSFSVSFQLELNGLPLLNTYSGSANYDDQGHLTYLSIPYFTVGSSSNYPFQSPADALAAANTAFDQFRSAYVNNQANSVTPPTSVTGGSTGTGSVPDSGATTATTPPSGIATPTDTVPPITTTTLPALVDTVINNVGLGYVMNQDKDGNLWLIPFYTFTSASGTRYIAPAISEQYINMPATIGVWPISYVNFSGGLPIRY